MVADAEDGDVDALGADRRGGVRLHGHRGQAVRAAVRDVGLEERHGRLPEGREDVLAEVELVVAERERVVPDRVERLDQRVDAQLGGQHGAVRRVAQAGALEVVHHRVALDVVARGDQQGAVGVVRPLLVDQRDQLAVALVGPGLEQPAVRVVVVQDRQRDDLVGLVGVVAVAVAGDAPVEGAVAVGSLVGVDRGVGGAHVRVDRVEHVAPVRDVLQVLERHVAVLAGRGEELVGADLVGLGGVERLPHVGCLVVDLDVIRAPRVRLRAGLGVAVAEELEPHAGRLDGPLEQGRRLVEQVVDLRPGHRPDRRRVAERQDLEHLAVGEEHRVVRPQPLRLAVGRGARPDPVAGARRVLLVAPVDADAAGVVEEHVDVVRGVRVRVEGAVDRVVHEVAHHVVAVVVAQQVDLAVADGLVDQGDVGRVGGVVVDQRLDRRILRVARAHDEARPVDGDRAGRRHGDVRAADLAAGVVRLDHGGAADHLGRGDVRVAVAADDQVRGLARVDQHLGEGLVAVDREAVAVAAVVEPVVAQDDDHVGLGLDGVVVVEDRLRGIAEAQAIGRLGDRDVRRLHRPDADHADLHLVGGRADREHLVRRHAGVERLPRAGAAAVLLGDVGRDHLDRRLVAGRGRLGLRDPVPEDVLAPVELVVAECRGVVAERPVVVDRGQAVLDVGQQAALHDVAGVEQEHLVGADRRSHALDRVGDPRGPGVRPGRLEVAVEVVGVQDRERHVAAGSGDRRRRTE